MASNAGRAHPGWSGGERQNLATRRRRAQARWLIPVRDGAPSDSTLNGLSDVQTTNWTTAALLAVVGFTLTLGPGFALLGGAVVGHGQLLPSASFDCDVIGVGSAGPGMVVSALNHWLLWQTSDDPSTS